MVHGTREWQATSEFLPRKPNEQHEKTKDRTLKDEPPGQQVPNMLLEISGEITPERMKGWSQSKNNTVVVGTGDRSKV